MKLQSLWGDVNSELLVPVWGEQKRSVTTQLKAHISLNLRVKKDKDILGFQTCNEQTRIEVGNL